MTKNKKMTIKIFYSVMLGLVAVSFMSYLLGADTLAVICRLLFTLNIILIVSAVFLIENTEK
jgi:hypothetical protein